MKKIYIILVFVLAVFLPSCSPVHTLTIKGEPGSVISSKPTIDNEVLGTINNSGTTTIELTRKHYQPFLFSINPQTQKATPFALDFYEDMSKQTTERMIWGGALTSLSCILFGSISLIASQSPIISVFGLLLSPCALATDWMKNQDDIMDKYSYSSIQVTNEDLNVR